MNFTRLTAKVSTGETFALYENGEYKNFDKLKGYVGKDYTNLNDDLMNGPSSDTWLEDPMHPVYTKWENGEEKFKIEFEYEV